VKPPPFEYLAPETVEEALAMLAQHGDDAKVLAGGQSLIPVLNFRLARPAVLVDLNRIASLAGIAEHDGGIRMGAMTRQRQAEKSALVKASAPLLAETLPHIAHVQIRNRGTVGGSLAHADPAAELPAIALALNCRVRLQRATGERWLDARDFFTGLFATALLADALLVEIELPALPEGASAAFEEVARRHGDYALMGVAALMVCDGAGICRDVRLAYVNAGPGPLRATRAEAMLVGQLPDAEVVRACADAASQELRPGSDVHASSAYRRQLARVLTERAIQRALAGRAA
jgi:carbon-monoxide dehydrogenase medium subunit